MEPLVSMAREFAIEAHGNQQYGAHPYRVHLDAVAELAGEYGETAQVVAYLHDVVEDTPVELEAIAAAFGQRVADCVSILTDEPGENRQERKRKTYSRMAQVSGDLELALIVKAADRLANMRACVADGNDELLAVYKQEHPAFEKAAYRQDLCFGLWYEMDRICASAQHGGYSFRFYTSERHSLIRVRHRPRELHRPEIFVAGKWVTGPPSVMAAIYGMGDDVWSGPDYFADPLTPEQARAYATERGIDLFAENADDPRKSAKASGSARQGRGWLRFLGWRPKF